MNKAKTLQELGIDEETYLSLVKEAAGQVVDFFSKADPLVSSQNHEELSKAAHFIKGSTGTLGMEDIYLISKDIELMCKEKKDFQTITSKIAELKVALDAFKKETGF